MARLARIDIAGLPQHLIVRGNNRDVLFRDDADRMIFLRFLEEAIEACACDLHAYVLMTNHVHLLSTGHIPGELSEMMQRIGRRFARLMNMRWGRTGTLFEGRFRSSLVDSEAYLLKCMSYIELNPVRAGMVRSPADYAWSSYGENSTGSPGRPLVAHPVYRTLGSSNAERGAAYRELVGAGITDKDLECIRTSARRCRALGSEAFCATIGSELERPAAPRAPGRPGKGDRSKN
jgi:putative transposase